MTTAFKTFWQFCICTANKITLCSCLWFYSDSKLCTLGGNIRIFLPSLDYFRVPSVFILILTAVSSSFMQPTPCNKKDHHFFIALWDSSSQHLSLASEDKPQGRTSQVLSPTWFQCVDFLQGRFKIWTNTSPFSHIYGPIFEGCFVREKY